ncbi:hypothetical protein [uncultured Apibacter sp.]|uniref:hypothetical protein n=1 Tax=uncultured Apibacter sp. TaxID=1778616 RepID=UPI0034535F3E
MEIHKAVHNPKGSLIRFTYDALGRKTAKIVNTKIYRYFKEGNVFLYQWSYMLGERPKNLYKKNLLGLQGVIRIGICMIETRWLTSSG